MIEISKQANKNYLCKIVNLKNLRKHTNADRLQVIEEVWNRLGLNVFNCNQNGKRF